MKFKRFGKSNPFEHHFGGYHDLFHIKNPLNPITNSQQSQQIIPKQIHKEFFGYVCFWSPKLNLIPKSITPQRILWICVFLVSQTQFDTQTHNSPEFPILMHY